MKNIGITGRVCFYLLLTQALPSVVSLASPGWRPETQKALKALQKQYAKKNFTSADEVHTFGKLQLSLFAGQVRIHKYEFNDPTLFENEGRSPRYSIIEPKGKHGEAPLVVLFPGMFSDVKGSEVNNKQVRYIAKLIHRTGSRVLILPNPWSERYLESWPKAMSGEVTSEARVALKMIETAVAQQIGRENISKLDFYGESYGAFLSAVTGSLFAETPLSKNLKLSSVTMVAVPFHFTIAMRALDKKINAEKANYFTQNCRRYSHRIFSKVKVGVQVLKHKDSAEIKESLRACVDSIFAYTGFQEHLLRTAQIYNERRVKQQGFELNESNWEETLDFQKFGTLFFPDRFEALLANPDNDLTLWLKRLDDQGVPYQGLSAENDPLNVEILSETQNSESLLSDKNSWVILKSGGHLGFIMRPHFKELIYRNFSVNSP